VGAVIAAQPVLVLQTRHFLFVMLFGTFLHIPAEIETTGLLRELQTQYSMSKTHDS
jgi:hypothetical protein